MVDYDYTSHEYRNGKKRFVPKSDYVKFHDGYWYPVRMTTYLYWFKFLQEAELSREFEVDWKKYKDWGSKEEIMDKIFPLNFIWEFKKQFFDEKSAELFGMKERNGIPIDVKVIDSDPKTSIFHKSSIDNIKKWRFKRKLVNGDRVEEKGFQKLFTFELK